VNEVDENVQFKGGYGEKLPKMQIISSGSLFTEEEDGKENIY
jgi:hypothetical protein